MTRSPGHIAVVGAGVFGVSAAVELRRRGWAVTLVDPGPLPHAAASSTDVSKVIRMDYGSELFYHRLGEAALEGWDRWNRDWPRELYHENGFLILSAKPMNPGDFAYESYQALIEGGHSPVRLTDIPATRTERWDLTGYADGYFNPRAGWAESGAVVEQLLGQGEALGVEVHAGAMRHLLFQGSRATGIMTTNDVRIDADIVLVAAGSWTPSLFPWMSDLIWSTGQPVIHFQVEDPAAYSGDHFPPWAADIANSGWYGFPALPDGRVKVANHGPGAPAHPDARGVVGPDHDERARAFLRAALPGLADKPIVYRRICMYCDSFDGDLLISGAPDREGLFVATGGSGHGFKFAPVMGDLIADVVEGAENRWASRFAWRTRTEVRTEEARFNGE
ncbi:MAG: FAD-dependent oxidoreductase [Gemmatimonadetes bacterium]|nr:FAD-dependent oxidoreductase [Gemmatimonadota bacterium]